MAEPSPAIDPELLERLRRGVPLRMTATGRLLFDGAPVTHPRVDAALRAGLDVSDTGEATVRIGPHWCYLTVDDLPLRATAARMEAEGIVLRLDDGRELPLDPSTLWEEPDRGLRCTVPAAGSGRPIGVRLGNHARLDLEPWLALDDHGAFVLRLPKGPHPIPTSRG